MIMEWKRNTDGTFQGTWRGTHLVLAENPVTKRWHLLADDVLVTQNWPASRKAMNEIELRQQKIVMRLAHESMAKTTARFTEAHAAVASA